MPTFTQVIENLPAEDYHRRDELSSSMVSDFLEDEELFHRYHVEKSLQREPTKDLEFGNIVHEVLENRLDWRSFTERVPSHVLNKDGHRKGKNWLRWSSAHVGKHWVNPGTRNIPKELCKSIQSNNLALQFARCETKELTIVWDHHTGLKCRCRIDVVGEVSIDGQKIKAMADWKTTRTKTVKSFVSEIENRHYAERMAFYQLGYKAAFGEMIPFVFLPIQKNAPWTTRNLILDSDWVKAAHKSLDETLIRISQFDIESHRKHESELIEVSRPRWAEYDDQYKLESEAA